MSKSTSSGHGLGHELRLIVRRARQVWRLVPLRYKWAFAGAALLMAVTSAASTAVPLLLGTLVDRIKLGTEQQATAAALYYIAVFYLGLIGVTYLLREALQVARRYFVENACTRIDRDLTVRLVSHLMRIDLATFTTEKVGALQGRISRSVDGFVRFLRLSFLDFFPALLTGVFALIAAVCKQPWLGLVMACVIPASVLLTALQLTSQKGVRLKLLRTREEMDGTVVELLSGLDYVRAADTQRHEVKRVARVAETRRAREIRHHFQMSLYGCAKALNEGLFHIIVLSLAIYYAIQGEVSFGDVLTFSILFLNVMNPLSEVHRIIDEGHESSLRVGDLLEMLSEPTDRSFHPAQTHEPRLDGSVSVVEAQGLRVEYVTSTGEHKVALRGIDLCIQQGETIGIAGRSGCGKSTWLKVLLRLTHPCGGTFRLGGVPLEEVSREAIGRLVGYVGQSPFVFAGTIADNIAYGVEKATMEQIAVAAQRACIHDEVLAMPGGYDAVVAERGQNLSGGQRQRLALARLFLKNPPLLILDEATSALDTISERSVQRALAEAREGRTVILVAHRLSTLLDADRILVFDDGRIVESGTYQELVRKGGAFTELLRHAEESPRAHASPEPKQPELAASA
jgi:ATP-binding cassette subfamily B protein